MSLWVSDSSVFPSLREASFEARERFARISHDEKISLLFQAKDEVQERWKNPELLGSIEGLHANVVAQCIESSLRMVHEDSLYAVARGPSLVECAGFSFAGNVFTAPIKPWLAAFMRGVPSLSRLSRHDSHFAEDFAQALNRRMPGAAQTFCCDPENDSIWTAFGESVSTWNAFGSDTTISRLRDFARGPFWAHGAGFGIALVDCTQTRSMREDAIALAYDVALYDQNGCLSPAGVFVVGSEEQASDFRGHLADALALVGERFPRHSLSQEERALERSYRDIGFLRGDCLEGKDFTLVWNEPLPIRLSAGIRALSLHRFDSFEDSLAALVPMHSQLSRIGCSQLRLPDLEKDLANFPRSSACVLGHMQSPMLLEAHDGVRFDSIF